MEIISKVKFQWSNHRVIALDMEWFGMAGKVLVWLWQGYVAVLGQEWGDTPWRVKAVLKSRMLVM